MPQSFRRAIAAAAALLCLSGTPAYAADDSAPPPGQVHDLLHVYLLALDNNPGYQARLAAYRAVAEQQPLARARLLPKLGVSGEYQRVRQKVEGDYFGFPDIRESDTFDRFAWGVALSQPVFHRDILLGLDRAELEVGRGKLLLTSARHELLLRAAEIYFALLSAQDNLRLVRAEKEAFSRQYDQVQGRFDSGLTAEAEVLAVQAQLDNVMASEIEAENAIDIARTRLEFLTGRIIPRVRTFGGDTPLPRLLPEDLDTWVERSQQHNLRVLAQAVGVRVAEVDTRIAQAQYLPRLDIVGSHVDFDKDGGISGARRDRDSRIGLELTMPLFTGGATQARVRQAQALHEEQYYEEQEVRSEARLLTRTAYLNARAARSRADALVRAVESASAAEETAEVGFEVGTITAADYLSGVRERYRAERNLSEARYQYVLGLLRLRQAAGVLTVADIEDLNEQLR